MLNQYATRCRLACLVRDTVLSWAVISRVLCRLVLKAGEFSDQMGISRSQALCCMALSQCQSNRQNTVMQYGSEVLEARRAAAAGVA